MSENSSTIADMPHFLRVGVRNILKEVHTAMPAIIENFDSSTMTASVQPAIQRLIQVETPEGIDTRVQDLPLCINVQVIFSRGGGYSTTYPIKAGDECLLMFSERCIDLWALRGGKQPPREIRFHDLSDGMAIVGLSSQPNKIKNFYGDGIEIRKDDGSSAIRISQGNVEVIANTKVTITSPSAEFSGDLKVNGSTTLAAVTASGTANFNGSINNLNIDIGSTHTHTNGNNGAPTGAVIP